MKTKSTQRLGGCSKRVLRREHLLRIAARMLKPLKIPASAVGVGGEDGCRSGDYSRGHRPAQA